MSDESRLIISVDTRTTDQNLKSTTTELDRTTAAGNKTAGSFDQMSNSGGQMSAMLGQLAAGFSVLKFASLINNTLATADAMQKTGIQIGITTEALSQLHFAAEQTGVSIGGLDSSLERMARRAAAAAEGTGAAVNAYNELNINVEEFNRLEPDQQLLALADAFEDVEGTSDKTRLAFDLFGKSGVEMVQMLEEGTEGIEALMKEADELGRTLSQETANAAAEFNDTVNAMKSQMQGATMIMVEAMLPALQNMADAMTETGETGDILNEIFATIGRTVGGLVQVFTEAGTYIGNALAGPIILLTEGLDAFHEHNKRAAEETVQGFENIFDAFAGQNVAVVEGNERASLSWREVNIQIDENVKILEEASNAAGEHNKMIEQLENSFRSFVHSVDDAARAQYEYEQTAELLAQAQLHLGLSSEEATRLMAEYLVQTGETAKEVSKEIEYAHQRISQTAGRIGQEFGKTMTRSLIQGKADWASFAEFVIGQIAKIVIELSVMNSLAAGGAGAGSTGTVMGAIGAGIGGYSSGSGSDIIPMGGGAAGYGGGSSVTNAGDVNSFSSAPIITVQGSADPGTVQALQSATDSIVRQTKAAILQDIQSGGQISRAVGRRN